MSEPVLWSVVAGGLLVFIWGGYPALIQVLSLRKSPPAIEASPLPRVTLILASCEGVGAVAQRLENIRASDYPSELLEIVASLDVPKEAFAQHQKTLAAYGNVVAADPPGGKANALNAGVREATGEILVFTDTHQRFDSQTIRRLVVAMTSPSVGAVSGALQVARHRASSRAYGLYWRAERRLREREYRIHSAVGVSGSVYAMRRSLWTPLPSGLILDDLYVPMNIALHGHRVGFEPTAVASETRKSTPEIEYRRKVRTLTGILQLCFWLPDILVPFRNPIWVQFVCHKLLRMLTPFITAVVLFGVVLSIARLDRPYLYGSVLLLAALLGCLLLPFQLARRLRRNIRAVLLMQLAVAVAVYNGLAHRWDVWLPASEPSHLGDVLAASERRFASSEGFTPSARDDLAGSCRSTAHGDASTSGA